MTRLILKITILERIVVLNVTSTDVTILGNISMTWPEVWLWLIAIFLFVYIVVELLRKLLYIFELLRKLFFYIVELLPKLFCTKLSRSEKKAYNKCKKLNYKDYIHFFIRGITTPLVTRKHEYFQYILSFNSNALKIKNLAIKLNISLILLTVIPITNKVLNTSLINITTFDKHIYIWNILSFAIMSCSLYLLFSTLRSISMKLLILLSSYFPSIRLFIHEGLGNKLSKSNILKDKFDFYFNKLYDNTDIHPSSKKWLENMYAFGSMIRFISHLVWESRFIGTNFTFFLLFFFCYGRFMARRNISFNFAK